MSNQGSTGSAIKGMIKVIVYFEILCLWLGFSLGIISSVIDMSDLCFKRYNDSMSSSSVTVQTNVALRADARYDGGRVKHGRLVSSGSSGLYNQWKKANFQVQKNQSIPVKISGEVSLCRAYLPLYHLQDVKLPVKKGGEIYYTKPGGDKIPIPRISENVEPLTLIFDAKTRGWRNLTEVYRGDIVKVILKDDAKSGTIIEPKLKDTKVTEDDCNKLKDPIDVLSCKRSLNIGNTKLLTMADCNGIKDKASKKACIMQVNGGHSSSSNLSIALCNKINDNAAKNSCIQQANARAPPAPHLSVPICKKLTNSSAKTTCTNEVRAEIVPPSELTLTHCNKLKRYSAKDACINEVRKKYLFRSPPSLPDCSIITDPVAKATCIKQVKADSTLTLDACNLMNAHAQHHCKIQVNSSIGAIPDLTLAICNKIKDNSAKNSCINQVNRGVILTLDACSKLSSLAAKSACMNQVNAATLASAPKMTKADCKRLAPHLVKACIKSIPKGSIVRNPVIKPAPKTVVKKINIKAVSVTDSVRNIPMVGYCTEGSKQYNPVCGRYSLWNGKSRYYPASRCTCHKNPGQHDGFAPIFVAGRTKMPVGITADIPTHSTCKKSDCICQKKCSLKHLPWDPLCWGGTKRWVCKECWHSCYTCSSSTMPEPYMESGTYTKSRFTNENFLLQNWDRNPAGSNDSCTMRFTPPTKFWFSAKDAAGLQYRFHDEVYPGSSLALGKNYQWAELIDHRADVYEDQYTKRKIYSNQFDKADYAYMQYRFHGSEYSNTQTGGYVLQLLQTKCRRQNGNVLDDVYPRRGAVEYLILPPGKDPNKKRSLASSPKELTFKTGSTVINSGSEEGNIWFKIRNNPKDYPESIGSYRITLTGNVDYGSFTAKILDPLFKMLRGKIYAISMGTFENITCYKKSPTDSCMNFFNYLRAMMMIYVAILGFRFLLGSKIKHEELVKSILKIAIIAGLINGGTFEFFREYIYPIVTGFSDQIIANMSGFSMLSATNSVHNPFMFADALLAKMFMSPTFLFQLLTTMAMGITGVLYFMVICVSIVVFIIAIFRTMAIYIMAMIATALLIGLAPFFISFILFERTYYLFENWAKFTFRYMVEPVIVMAGIIILTQLFSLYVDQVLSFSLCWKCALPFKIPFASLLPFPGLENIPIFCIYWFSPWGLDPVNDPMGIDLAMVVGLAMVAYSAYGYVEFASKIATRLVGSSGGPSSITLGSDMAKDAGSRTQKRALLAQDYAAKKMSRRGKDNDSDENWGDEGGSSGDPRRPSVGGGSAPDGDVSSTSSKKTGSSSQRLSPSISSGAGELLAQNTGSQAEQVAGNLPPEVESGSSQTSTESAFDTKTDRSGTSTTDGAPEEQDDKKDSIIGFEDQPDPASSNKVEYRPSVEEASIPETTSAPTEPVTDSAENVTEWNSEVDTQAEENITEWNSEMDTQAEEILSNDADFKEISKHVGEMPEDKKRALLDKGLKDPTLKEFLESFKNTKRGGIE